MYRHLFNKWVEVLLAAGWTPDEAARRLRARYQRATAEPTNERAF